MNPFQKGMQKSMTEANKVPHLYYNEVMDITELDSMREKLKSSGLKVTVMGIITKTFSLALTDNPKMNSSYRTDKN
jgi:2-oxoisovalerate dehydrogenase E2 component (dihydrolipoyl transacylase)